MPSPLGSPLHSGLRVLVAALLAVVAGACTSQNVDHCNFRGGDSFCADAQSERPFCSVCVADFDGCSDQPPGAECLPEGSSSASASASASTVSDATSTTDVSTSTTATTATTSTTDGETTTSTTATTSTTSTTDGTSTSGDSDTSTTGTGTDTDTDTDGPDLCGNGVLDENEVCDGDKFGGKTCLDFGWTGGKLGCADDCSAISQSNCCQGGGSACSGSKPCCANLECTLQPNLSLQCE
ncbi:MAG: hypothetical protein R3A79_19875 [Nannocystaceae bacterium]